MPEGFKSTGGRTLMQLLLAVDGAVSAAKDF
jgi:hypothetical protein